MHTFEGKVAAITGASSGIGRALAIELAAQGCHLSLSSRNAVELAQTARLARVAAREKSVHVTTTQVDVADQASLFALFESIGGGSCRQHFEPVWPAVGAGSWLLQRFGVCGAGLDARFMDKMVRLLGSAYQPLIVFMMRKMRGRSTHMPKR